MVKSHKRGSSSSPNVGHHFFKVYLPSESSTRLKIPATFINDLSGALPKQIILKDSFRRLYRIEVKKVEGDFFFQNGWQAFVKKHSLVVGEFLVFRYDGNSMFEVNIYDHSGCEKEETSSDMNIDHSTRIVMVEDEEARETIRKCSREPQRKYSGIMKGVRKFGYGRTGTKPQRTDVGNNENDLVFKASGSYKQNASFNLFFDRHKPYHVMAGTGQSLRRPTFVGSNGRRYTIHPEKRFQEFFQQPEAKAFYPRRIRNRGWDPLFYGPDSWHSPLDVCDFYSEMVKDERTGIHNYRGRNIDCPSIAAAIGLPPHLEDTTDMHFPGGMKKLCAAATIEGTLRSNGSMGLTSLRRNQMALAHWLSENVLPNSKSSDVTKGWLVFMLTIQEPNRRRYCLSCAIASQITSGKRVACICPTLVTRWLESQGFELIGREEDRKYLEIAEITLAMKKPGIRDWFHDEPQRATYEDDLRGYPHGAQDPLSLDRADKVQTQQDHARLVLQAHQYQCSFMQVHFRRIYEHLGIAPHQDTESDQDDEGEDMDEDDDDGDGDEDEDVADSEAIESSSEEE